MGGTDHGLQRAAPEREIVVLVARALTGALVFKEKVIILSAHEQKTSRVLFMNLLSYFENYADLSLRVRSVGRALGREEIRLRDRSGDDIHIFFPARTRTTLRGWSVDCYLADEAQMITNEQWESAKPTMSARRNTQTWLFGTTPQLITDAEVFGRLRAAAHAGTDGSLAWVEYGADPGCDLDDRDQWAAANPGRVELEAIGAERRELSPGGFARERLNIWPAKGSEEVFDMDRWASLLAPSPPYGDQAYSDRHRRQPGAEPRVRDRRVLASGRRPVPRRDIPYRLRGHAGGAGMGVGAGGAAHAGGDRQ